MNVASLQLEGLMMAIASINNMLVHKGLCPSTMSTSAVAKGRGRHDGRGASL